MNGIFPVSSIFAGAQQSLGEKENGTGEFAWKLPPELKNPSRMRTIPLLSVLVLLLSNPVRAQAKPDENGDRRPVVFDFIPDSPNQIDRLAPKIYADRFKVRQVTAKDDFRDARIKGYFYSIDDPRSMRVWRVPGKVEVIYVVNPEGRVTDARVLECTDPLFAKPMLESVRSRRFFPARYRGTPVFSLWSDSQIFGHPSDSGNGFREDGLGIMGYRDR
jgi:TonB-like protein